MSDEELLNFAAMAAGLYQEGYRAEFRDMDERWKPICSAASAARLELPANAEVSRSDEAPEESSAGETSARPTS